MYLRYSLYERTENGYQWTWRYKDLHDRLLDDFRYRIQMPDNLSEVPREHLMGGILKFEHEFDSSTSVHVVFFRFFNGGTDGGRSRVTMLAAWTTKDQVSILNGRGEVLDIFNNSMFNYVSKNAKTVGIEQPFSLRSDEQTKSMYIDIPPVFCEFVDGLSDRTQDYLLTIHNNNYILTKSPSSALQHEADFFEKQNMIERGQQNEVFSTHESTRRIQHKQLPKKLEHKNSKFTEEKRFGASSYISSMINRILWILCIIAFLFFAFVILNPYPYLNTVGSDSKSGITEILRLFKELSDDDKEDLIRILQSDLHSSQRSPAVLEAADSLNRFNPYLLPNRSGDDSVIQGKPERKR